MNIRKNKDLIKKEHHLSNESVRKHVAAIHTSGELSLLERKMANVLLLNAYDDLLTKRTHKIPIKLFTLMLGWDESNNIERLKAALKRLNTTDIVFDLMQDGKGKWTTVTMLSFGEIEKGVCSYRYDEFLAEKLYDPEIYATINIKIQRKLKGGYSLALYENCLRYKGVGSTGWWELVKFRRLLGVENEYYDDFRRLSEKIIKPAIKEINSSSDINIEVEFQRERRKVIAIRFLVTENPQQSIFNSSDEKNDEYFSVRESATYKRLKEHGIGDKLAVAWVLQDDKRASEVIAYVEEKDRKKKIKSSTGAYIKKLIEEGVDVGKPAYQTQKEAEAIHAQEIQKQQEEDQKLEDLKTQYKKEKVNALINNLSLSEKKKLTQEYLGSDGKEKGVSYRQETGEFQDRLEGFQFGIWLRARLSQPFSSEEFATWLRARLTKS